MNNTKLLNVAEAKAFLANPSKTGLEEFTDITAEAAKILSRFDGDVLWLDGLTAITPKAAENLLSLKGDLSLTGLTETSAELKEILSRRDSLDVGTTWCDVLDSDYSEPEEIFDDISPLKRQKTGGKSHRYNYQVDMQEVWPGNINGLSMQDRFWVFYTDCWHEPNERNRILHFGTLTWWPCDPSVRPGDYGIIYAKSPIKSIVAVVEVASDHFVYEGYDSCKITFDTILDPMLDLNDMKNSNELYNSWPLLRRNMQNPFGPQRLEKPALAALRTVIPQFDKMFKGS